MGVDIKLKMEMEYLNIRNKLTFRRSEVMEDIGLYLYCEISREESFKTKGGRFNMKKCV